MRWRDLRRSGNVQDRRGMGGLALGGGLGTVVIALVAMLFGVDPGAVLQQQPAGGAAGGPGAAPPPAAADTMAEFVDRVLGSTEDTWSDIFTRSGERYAEPTLVLFSGYDRSACGSAQAAMGPFYCPLDQTVYIDLSFFQDLRQQLGAPGDFAQAYVIAHEVGHHVQTLLGISERVHQARQSLPEAEANALSVRQELQADCFAGIWANRAQPVLEPGDIEEGLNAASAIGDDRLQRQSQGRVVPESFTHGTSAQRMRWFQRGYQTGQVDRCDTFNANEL